MSLRVVIAEDEAIIRMDLRETLEEEGYEVVGETGRGDQAVELVAIAACPISPSSTSRCRAWTGSRRPASSPREKLCGVLILTAFSQREVIEQARDAGALAYLVKPFQKSDLIPAIEVAIGRFRELRHLTGEIDALGEQLEARKTIDRAKGVLIDECGMKESRGVHLHPAHRDERAHPHARRRRPHPRRLAPARADPWAPTSSSTATR